jgi:hypothetical protein
VFVAVALGFAFAFAAGGDDGIRGLSARISMVASSTTATTSFADWKRRRRREPRLSATASVLDWS